MRIARIHVDAALETGVRILLPDAAAHHIVNVLRMRTGQPLHIFNGRGGYYDAALGKIEKHKVEITLGMHHPEERESPLRITLAQGISRGERMDYTLQKAVELGVHQIVPVLCTYTNVKLDAATREKRLTHWKKIIIGASEQCGRNRIPLLLPVQEFHAWTEQDTNAVKLLLHPEHAQPLGQLHPQPAALTLLAGPEGGFDEAEVSGAQSKGYQPIHLGPRILRTETAALAAISVCQALWGDLGQIM